LISSRLIIQKAIKKEAKTIFTQVQTTLNIQFLENT